MLKWKSFIILKWIFSLLICNPFTSKAHGTAYDRWLWEVAARIKVATQGAQASPVENCQIRKNFKRHLFNHRNRPAQGNPAHPIQDWKSTTALRQPGPSLTIGYFTDTAYFNRFPSIWSCHCCTGLLSAQPFTTLLNKQYFHKTATSS